MVPYNRAFTDAALHVAIYLHHVALVIASILFTYAGRILPKDAANYIEVSR